MDTSKEYIEMCKQAIELQVLAEDYEQKLSLIQNLYAIWGKGSVGWGESILPLKAQMSDIIETVWLPRQDQLQHMIPTVANSNFSHKEQVCYSLLTFFEQNSVGSFVSFEQTWLKIVMKELYNKHWSVSQHNWYIFTLPLATKRIDKLDEAFDHPDNYLDHEGDNRTIHHLTEKNNGGQITELLDRTDAKVEFYCLGEGYEIAACQQQCADCKVVQLTEQ